VTAWAFTLVYQEAALIAYWVRHYRSFCDKVIVYVDVESTDGTSEIAAHEGADVRPYDGGSTGLDDIAFVEFANRAYKEAVGNADWVIWADGDEILYTPNIEQRLVELQRSGVTVPHLNYYVMAAPGLPTHAGQIYDEPDFRRGHFVQADAKVAIFNPNILHIQWGPGKHDLVTAAGALIHDSNGEWLKLLHYRWLGEEYLRERDAQNYARLSLRARHGGYGMHVRPDFIGPYHPMWPGPHPADAEDILS